MSLASPHRDYTRSPPAHVDDDYHDLWATAGPTSPLLKEPHMSPSAMKLGTRSIPNTLPSYCIPATTSMIPGHMPHTTRITQHTAVAHPVALQGTLGPSPLKGALLSLTSRLLSPPHRSKPQEKWGCASRSVGVPLRAM